MLHKKILSFFLISSLALFFFAQSEALEKSYHIEFIIFSQKNESNENWVTESSNKINIQQTAGKESSSFKNIQPATFKLDSELHQLISQGGYRILLHQAWIVPTQDLKKGIKFRTQGGTHYESNQWELDGYLSIALNHYFNCNTDFLFTEPQSTLSQDHSNDTDNTLVTIPIHSSQRTKSNELNYLDHPLVGVLLKITPY